MTRGVWLALAAAVLTAAALGVSSADAAPNYAGMPQTRGRGGSPSVNGTDISPASETTPYVDAGQVKTGFLDAGNAQINNRLNFNTASGQPSILLPLGARIDYSNGLGNCQTYADGSNNFTVLAPIYPTGQVYLGNFTDDSATTGNRTVNKQCGINAFAAAATAITITNSLVSTASNVFCTLQTNDATAILKNCTPAAGSFTITLNAAATGTTKVGWCVFNH